MCRLAGRSADKARRLVSVLKGEVFTSHYELFKGRVSLSDVAAAARPSAPIPFSFFHSFFVSSFFLFIYLSCFYTPIPSHIHALKHIDVKTQIRAYSTSAHILYNLISLQISLKNRNTNLLLCLNVKPETDAVKLKMTLSIISSMFGKHIQGYRPTVEDMV